MSKCRVFDSNWLMCGVAGEMKRVAYTGLWNSQGLTPYFIACNAYHAQTGTQMALTRDYGHHSSGWFKNPDYERCLHLSLSFCDPKTKQPAGRDKDLTRQWLELIFGDNRSLLWTEPPYSDRGRQLDIWHYRLFFHPDWETPILPRKEVYTREFTEAGWKSWSDVQADLQEAQAAAIERLGNAIADAK